MRPWRITSHCVPPVTPNSVSNQEETLMKKLIAVSVLLTVFLTTSAVSAKDYALAFSPYQRPGAAHDQMIAALQFMTALKPGDSVQIFDGYHLSLIGTFNIPAKTAYNSVRARMAVNAKAVKALKTFIDAARVPGGNGHPTLAGSIRLPQLLRLVAMDRPANETMDVIVIGSPLYDDPMEPAYTMVGGRYPSDGHLSHGRRDTLYGAADSPTLLESLRLHISYAGNAIFASDRHHYAVERFYDLYMTAQGGQLISFAGDLDLVFKRVKNGAKAPVRGYKADGSDKLEMIRLRQVELKQSIYNRPLTHTPLTAMQVQRAEQIEVGISWDCETCDLDLYALAYPGADMIYFDQSSTSLGTLWKDHLRSPRGNRGFETIAFHQPLDLRRLKLAVNFYRGKAPGGVNGELRLAVGDKTYSQLFHIQADRGNQASASVRDSLNNNHPASRHTVIINPLELVSAR